MGNDKSFKCRMKDQYTLEGWIDNGVFANCSIYRQKVKPYKYFLLAQFPLYIFKNRQQFYTLLKCLSQKHPLFAHIPQFHKISTINMIDLSCHQGIQILQVYYNFTLKDCIKHFKNTKRLFEEAEILYIIRTVVLCFIELQSNDVLIEIGIQGTLDKQSIYIDSQGKIKIYPSQIKQLDYIYLQYTYLQHQSQQKILLTQATNRNHNQKHYKNGFSQYAKNKGHQQSDRHTSLNKQTSQSNYISTLLHQLIHLGQKTSSLQFLFTFLKKSHPTNVQILSLLKSLKVKIGSQIMTSVMLEYRKNKGRKLNKKQDMCKSSQKLELKKECHGTLEQHKSCEKLFDNESTASQQRSIWKIYDQKLKPLKKPF